MVEGQYFRSGTTCWQLHILCKKNRKTRGGGVLLNITNDFPSKRLCNLESNSEIYNEIIICELIYFNVKYAILLCYRLLDANFEFNSNFERCLNNVVTAG